MDDFANKIIDVMIINYMDEESFSKVVRMAVELTAEAAARQVSEYSDQRIPASEYSQLLRNFFNLK